VNTDLISYEVLVVIVIALVLDQTKHFCPLDQGTVTIVKLRSQNFSHNVVS